MDKIELQQPTPVFTYVPDPGYFAGRIVRYVFEVATLLAIATLVCCLWNDLKARLQAAYIYVEREYFSGFYVGRIVSQWREQHPDHLPQPPENGIQVGLPNLGNTCWFNSLIKFLASTTYFDPMLIAKGDEKKDELRQDLADLLIYLRLSGQEHVLSSNLLEDYFDRIVETITEFTDFDYKDGEQCDPSEFLNLLMQFLDWQPTDTVVVREYNSKTGNDVDTKWPVMQLNLPEKLKGSRDDLDLELHTNQTSQIEKGAYQLTFPTYLPDEFICIINRFDQAFLPKKNKEKETEKGKELTTKRVLSYRKHKNPIAISDGIIKIPLFGPEFGRKKPKGIEDIVPYKVMGSIIHHGLGIHSGHYTATELSSNEVHQMHDDEVVKALADWEEVNAYMLRLVRIHEG